jgi:hypothetical protein
VLPGWRLLAEQGTATAELDATNPRDGKTCLYVQNNGQRAVIESNPFPTPHTGQFAMTVFIRCRNLAPDAQLSMVVETGRSGFGNRWPQKVWGADAATKPADEQWYPYAILVDELPLESNGHLRVRFELSGAGEVWLDDARTYDLLFPLPFYRNARLEKLEFVKLISAAKTAYESGRVTDCVRALEGYWPRFLTEYTPLDKVAVQPPPSQPDRSPTATPPEAEEPKVGERVKNWNWWPWRR